MKKINFKKRIQKRNQNITIDYEKIILLFGPLVLISFVVILTYTVKTENFQEIKDFFIYKRWQGPGKNESTASAILNKEDDPDVVIEFPPELPEINPNLSTTQIFEEVEKTIDMINSESISFPIIEKIYAEAQEELEKGNEELAREKMIDGYKLAQEMYFAYQNKLIRFREATSSSEN